MKHETFYVILIIDPYWEESWRKELWLRYHFGKSKFDRKCLLQN